jgi:hypothetical protein
MVKIGHSKLWSSIDVKSGFSYAADLLQLGFQFDGEYERSLCELPGFGTDQKDPDSTQHGPGSPTSI